MKCSVLLPMQQWHIQYSICSETKVGDWFLPELLNFKISGDVWGPRSFWILGSPLLYWHTTVKRISSGQPRSFCHLQLPRYKQSQGAENSGRTGEGVITFTSKSLQLLHSIQKFLSWSQLSSQIWHILIFWLTAMVGFDPGMFRTLGYWDHNH